LIGGAATLAEAAPLLSVSAGRCANSFARNILRANQTLKTPDWLSLSRNYHVINDLQDILNLTATHTGVSLYYSIYTENDAKLRLTPYF